jgi:hypothetical protein
MVLMQLRLTRIAHTVSFANLCTSGGPLLVRFDLDILRHRCRHPTATTGAGAYRQPPSLERVTRPKPHRQAFPPTLMAQLTGRL